MKKISSILLPLFASLILVSFCYSNSNIHDPILIRHDKDEAEFFKLAERFEKYMCHLNLPDCEGTMIADQWAISAAHCAVLIKEKFRAGRKHFVIINDVEIEVDKVIMYKEWDNPQTGIESLNDIALLHLKTKPAGAKQAKLYVDEDEVDKLVYMVGRGDTGNGLNGVSNTDWKQRGATNRVETAVGNWITWTFDHPDTKTKYLTEYEGISGPGDSGGPAFIIKNNQVYLAGISSWQDSKGGDEGLYGVVENYARVSQYIKWISDEMTGNGADSEAILRIGPSPDAIVYKYEPKAIDISTRAIKQYVGEYNTESNTTVKVYTKENNKKFYLMTSDNAEYEFIPTGKHVFSSKEVEGFELEFKKPENEIFKELIAKLPDGTVRTAIRK